MCTEVLLVKVKNAFQQPHPYTYRRDAGGDLFRQRLGREAGVSVSVYVRERREVVSDMRIHVRPERPA